MTTRRHIEFDAEGVTRRGWFFPARGASEPAPTIVMAPGYSAVNEMYLDKHAEVFLANASICWVYLDERPGDTISVGGSKPTRASRFRSRVT